MSDCSCPIEPGMSYNDLKAIIERVLPNGQVERRMCSEDGMYMCSNLLKELNKAQAEMQRRKWYNERMKRFGYSEEEIANRPVRKRGASRGKVVQQAMEFDFNV